MRDGRCLRCCSPRCWIITGAVAVYFIAFPEDLPVLLSPIAAILSLTNQVSLGAYLLLGVVAICLTWRCCWCGKRRPNAPPDAPQSSATIR